MSCPIPACYCDWSEDAPDPKGSCDCCGAAPGEKCRHTRPRAAPPPTDPATCAHDGMLCGMWPTHDSAGRSMMRCSDCGTAMVFTGDEWTPSHPAAPAEGAAPPPTDPPARRCAPPPGPAASASREAMGSGAPAAPAEGAPSTSIGTIWEGLPDEFRDSVVGLILAVNEAGAGSRSSDAARDRLIAFARRALSAWEALRARLASTEETLRLTRDGADLLVDAEERAQAAEARAEAARAALAFAASVIKCGEPWTETCERVIGGALSGPGAPDSGKDAGKET